MQSLKTNSIKFKYYIFKYKNTPSKELLAKLPIATNIDENSAILYILKKRHIIS